MRSLRMRKDRHAEIEDKKPKTYIEGHPELFETKVFRISRGQKNVVAFSRDPGSAAALIPVMQILQKDGIGLSVVTDGRAEELMRKAFPTMQDATSTTPFSLESVIEKPDLILTDTSASERGLETFAAATFTDTPIVLVEDYYTTANNYLARLRDMHPPHMPAYVCVMDEAARDIIVRQFPEIADRVVVTGQPAFDRFAAEDVPAMRDKARKVMGLPDQILITYMGSPNQLTEMQTIAPFIEEAVRKSGKEVMFNFRRHPRDNTPMERYIEAFATKGVSVIDTSLWPTDTVAAASDVIMTNWSTEGVHAAFRRIPVLYVNDDSVRKPPTGITYPLPPVVLGAGLSARSISDIPSLLGSLLDAQSPTVIEMQNAMRQHYKTDGGNAARVAEIVRRALG
jgi:hypothetical protein